MKELFIPSDFAGSKGIILFEVSGWGDATGHFTLWNGSKVAHGDYFKPKGSAVLKGVKLWKIGSSINYLV